MGSHIQAAHSKNIEILVLSLLQLLQISLINLCKAH